ncbi:MAG: YadA-like family protein [[Pasteurella] aerogenes]|nr:YadA-like family protein [[Pasteurella] aerogenes]
MNKIYRVVFNHATQSWTAVAEIARAKGKGSSTTVGSTEQADAGSVSKLIRFTLVMSGMILSTQAIAATGTEYQAGTDNVCYFDTATNSVICGTADTQVTDPGQNAVAVGESATANAIQVTSVGYNAGQGSTNAANSTFIGTGAGANSNGTAQGTQLTTAYNTYVGSDAGNGATGVQNTAVGGSNAGAGVTGDANAAFGHASLYNTKGNLNTGLGAYAGQNSSGDSNTSVGDNAGRKVTGNNNTALGSNAGTGTKGSDNVAIGVDAGQSITAAETVSIGKGAKANNYKAVALGSGAVTDVSVDTKEATVNGITYGNFAGSESIATVSVGSKDNERTITNVAAGRISATSTDAINGSQLYMVADKLGTLNTEIANTYFHVNNGSNKDTGDATTNLGRITDAAGAKNVGAVTAGMNAVAETSQSIAIGQGAKAGAADRTGSSNWANIIDPRTKNPFTSEAELLAYYETVKTNPGNTVTRALIGKINNIAIGAGAVAEGGRNISIGEFAGVGTADNWNIHNVNIGSEAGQNSKKDYSVAVGYRAGALTDAQQLVQEGVVDGGRHPSVLIGKQAGEGTVAYGTVAIGQDAGKNISDIRSIKNIAIGSGAGQAVSSNDGRNATFPGFGAGANTMIGAASGRGLVGDGNVAIGNLSGSGTTGDNNFFGGHLAGANGSSDRSIIIGSHAGEEITSDRSVFIGNYAHSEKKGNVVTGIAIGNNTLAGQNTDGSITYNSIAIGNSAAATNDNTIALGRSASASGLRSTAIGSGANSSGEQAIAIGRGAVALGAQSIAIGTENRVTANNAGAIGDPSIVAGAGSYTLGNDNAVGSTSTNVGAFGNNNQIGATATYDANGKLLLASGLTDTAAVENARAVGNKNYINTSNTYVLGSGVGTKDDGSVLGTVENSVYLGNDSTVAKGAAVGTKNLTKEGAEGATTTAGDTGEVTSATVSGVTYGSFAGKTAAGAVSVGSADLERRVMNVAAGEISATSTDAINGSQLYMVAQGTLDQMPVIYTDTNGNKLIKSPDGNFYPAGTVLDATGKPVDTTIQPVTNVIASMNDGDNIANTPKTLANVAGSLTPTYNKGDMTIGTDGKPTDTAAGGPTILQTGPKAEDAAKIYNNAATVGDVLNAGWNLQGNGSAQDFVKPYDTVNFADGTGTTVDVTTDDGKTSTIKVNVDAQSTVESAQTPVVYTNKEGDKLIKGDDGKFYPADSVKIGDNYYPAGTTEDENGNPVDANGDTVTALTPTGTGDIIASMNNGDNSTTAPMTLTNIASNLPNTYNKDAYNTADAPVTTSQALPDNLNVNNAATVGDVLNAGWNLQGNGTAKDFVKPYDTVNFADGTGTTVDVSTDEDGKVSTIKVNVDAQAVTNNSQLPVVYTDKDGKQVYPIVDEDGNVTYNTQPDGKGDVVAKGDVITSINGPEGTTTPTTLTNVASNLPNTYNNDAYNTGDAPVTTEQALPVDEQGNPTLNVNNAATVGDILNAGWNLQGNGTAKDFVKPYDTVNFADGTGTTVDVSTDEEGKVSTIKVNVDAQTVTNDSQLPVVYTDKNGNQVYPIVDDQGNVTYNTQPDGKGDTVDKGDVITSINGPDGTTTPTTLTNVASNLPNTYNTDVYNTTNQPVTVSQALPTGLNVNNAATVGDILNAGWNLQGNGVAKDFVKPYDTVNFVNGNATTATVETAADGKSSTVKYDVQVDGNTIKVVDGKLTAAADSNTVTGVTAGDNITVTSTIDASGNPTYTVATKKDVTFDSVTITNGPIINGDGINMNGDKITNVADGDISPTSKDAVNGSQLYSAVNNINSNIAASKEEVTSNDKSVTVTTTKNASGSNVFDLSVNTDGTTITKNAGGALTVNTTPLTNNTDGSVNTPAAPNAIATAGDVANVINNSGFTLTAQGSNGSLVKPGSTVDMNNTDGNIVISKSASDNKVTYNLAKDIKVDSVTTGNTVVDNSGVTINNADPAKTVSLTENGLNNGRNRITNVADGEDGNDAVNMNQLNQVNNNVVNLNNKVNRVDRDLRGGIAGANAAAALPQAYIPGKSMVAAAAGTYRGQSALAVGYSRISDNGKIILKLQGNTNTRGDIGGAIGVGYQW